MSKKTRALYLLGVAALIVPGAAFATPYTAENGAAYTHTTGDAATLEFGAVTASNTAGIGSYAWGVLVHADSDGDASSLDVTHTTVWTTGESAHGIQAGVDADGADASSVVLGAGVAVSTAGDNSNGLRAINGASISGAATVITSGTNAYGAFADSSSVITLNGGRVETSGETAHALTARNTQNLSEAGGVISATGVTLSTTGAGGVAVYALNEGAKISLVDSEVITTGIWATGVLAANGEISLTDTHINTSGASSAGASAQGGLLTISGGSVTTLAWAGAGLSSNDEGRLLATGTVIRTAGQSAYGLYAQSAGLLTANDIDVATEGQWGHGVFATSGGEVNLSGGSVVIEHETANAINVVGSGTVVASDVLLLTENSATAGVSTYSNDDEINVILRGGDSLIVNNGALLDVDVREYSYGSTVRLVLADGVRASGHVSGSTVTDFIVTDGSEWIGSAEVKSVLVEGYSTAIFNTPSYIGQDLIVNNSEVRVSGNSVIAGNVNLTESSLYLGTNANIRGNLVLSGNSSTSGGELYVPEIPGTPDGRVTVDGDVLVGASARLGGNFYIAGNLRNEGIIDPGNSFGVMSIAQNLELGSFSVLKMEIDNSGASDTISVEGEALLDGTLELQLVDPLISYRGTNSYTLIRADGGFDGEFKAVIAPSIFFGVDLDYAEGALVVTTSLAANAFEASAVTANQTAVARKLDGLAQNGDPLKLYNSVAFLQSFEAARNAYDQLSAVGYASVKAGLVENAHLLSDATNERIRMANAKGEAGINLWLNGMSSWSNHGSNANVGDLKSSTSGVLFGVDGSVDGGVRVGVVAGYSESDFRMLARTAETESENIHLGAYAGYSLGEIHAKAGVNYSWHKLNAKRSVGYLVDPSEVSYSAGYKARTLQAYAEVAHDLKAGNVTFQPFAGINYVSVSTRSAQEAGGLAALSIKGDSTNTTFSSLGLRGSLEATSNVRLNGSAGWRHAFGDVITQSAHAFSDDSGFTVDGIAVSKDVAAFELGVDANITEKARFGLGYFGRYGKDFSQNGVKASLAIAF